MGNDPAPVTTARDLCRAGQAVPVAVVLAVLAQYDALSNQVELLTEDDRD